MNVIRFEYLGNFRFADWKTRKKKFVQYEVQYEGPRLFISVLHGRYSSY